jgi:hypothetical protein
MTTPDLPPRPICPTGAAVRDHWNELLDGYALAAIAADRTKRTWIEPDGWDKLTEHDKAAFTSFADSLNATPSLKETLALAYKQGLDDGRGLKDAERYRWLQREVDIRGLTGSVLRAITNCDGNALDAAIDAEVLKMKLTGWFDWKVRPVREGWYELRGWLIGDGERFYWNGSQWGHWNGPHRPEYWFQFAEDAGDQWRGIYYPQRRRR